ncbi:rCG31687, isoform CRA_a [Rattus norvegicus]|uniref:RCG31687, isoform CRA_a n=1 Tax=Rattus norvegicus TaxID=10116 RepID=A6JNU4_RAT|nr:rCG31687, isoform CRA_a [Rattus norvegicus]
MGGVRIQLLNLNVTGMLQCPLSQHYSRSPQSPLNTLCHLFSLSSVQ